MAERACCEAGMKPPAGTLGAAQRLTKPARAPSWPPAEAAQCDGVKCLHSGCGGTACGGSGAAAPDLISQAPDPARKSTHTRGRYHDAVTLHQQALITARATGDQATRRPSWTRWSASAGYTCCRAGPSRPPTTFAQRATTHDRDNSFPFENYDDLRDGGFLKLTVPTELGGLGAGLAEVLPVLERLAVWCGCGTFGYPAAAVPSPAGLTWAAIRRQPLSSSWIQVRV
jgi:hypothetical protein